MGKPMFIGDVIRSLDNGEFVCRYGGYTIYSAYQPIYRCTGQKSLEFVGLEGLIRPYVDDVSITPSLLYQQTDVTDAWYVDGMCTTLHIRNFQAAMPAQCDLYLTVNPASYPSLQLLKAEFNQLLGRLEVNDISPGSIVLEVFETEPCCPQILTWLRAFAHDHGLKFAMDDFGHGKSNWQRYQMLNPDMVKVDGQKFALGKPAMRGADDLAAMIKRVHQDGGEVVIEGIDTSAMLSKAVELNADLLKGNYLDLLDEQSDKMTGSFAPVSSVLVH